MTNDLLKKWADHAKPVGLPGPLSPLWAEVIPDLLPAELIGTRLQRAFHHKHGLCVIIDCSKKSDNKFWTHVSFSYEDRMPSYDEIVWIKTDFIGSDRKAIFILPEQQHHVNIHSYCLHLWSCEEGDGLPEFSGVIPNLGRSI